MSAAQTEHDAASADAETTRPLGFLLRKFWQKNQVIWHEMCPDPQMTSVQSAALSVLARSGSCSLTALGKAAAMDPATTRGVVERLRRRGMISLQDDALDRRKVIIRLEAPGRRFLSAMKPVMPQIAAATLTPLNPAERLALSYLLAKVTASEEDGC